MTSDILIGLGKAIADYDGAAAADWARQSVESGIDPVEAFDAMTAAISAIGDKFEAGECWLPDLIGAADAMEAAKPILQEQIARTGGHRDALGTVVAGTVHGDIHSIGIEMVCTLLTAAGFDVHYLGIDVSPEGFIEAVRERKADIIGMSALLTVTAAEQEKVVKGLVEAGLRDGVKVMVGGGAITEDFAAKIGADGYAPAAPGAVELAKQFVGAA
jgi:trimethylamine corrinoid protein